jgi:excisionase family DNA binding protein
MSIIDPRTDHLEPPRTHRPQAPLMVERLAYTIPDAAEAVSVSEDTIRNAIAGGNLSAYRPRIGRDPLRTLLIDADELRAWLRAGERA